MNNLRLKYILGAIISIPILPILFFQGKKIRKNIPKLPEAKIPKGLVNNNFKNTLHVITIGESTIAGVGVDTHKNGFTGALAKELSTSLKTNISWQVYAKSGYTAQLVAKKLIPKIDCKKVDIIVIGLGGNNAFTLNSPKDWNLAIDNLINLLQKKFPETPIYFTNMPPIKEFPAFTKSIKFVIGNLVELLCMHLKININKYKNVYYNNEIITLKSWSKRHNLPQNNATIYFSDGVHPSKLTYKVWGKEMAQFIVSNFTNTNKKE